MKFSFMLFLALSLLSFNSMAYTYVKCGDKVTEDFDVEGYQLELSSEEDTYEGPVAGTWNLKLGSEETEWLAANPKVTAKTVDEDIVEITIVKAQSISPVGIRYKLIGLWAESPVLEKYQFGGFAGTIKTGTYECINGSM